MIQTRVDRSGALRRIDEIRARKPDKNQQKGRKTIQQDDADADAANKQKLNIFDAQDSTVLKHETLARIGLDDATQAIEGDQMSEMSGHSSHQEVKLKPIDYLNKTR
jgi:hypothetical protein